MAWYDNFRNALHPYDDEYMENEAAAAEEAFGDYEPPRSSSSPVFEEPKQPASPVYEEPAQPSYEEPRRSFSKRAQPTPPPAGGERGKMKLVFQTPNTFEDARGIADHLRARRAVLLNIESCDAETARRMLDFLSGVAYALGGRVNRVSARAFVVTPVNVDLVGDIADEFENGGMYF